MKLTLGEALTMIEALPALIEKEIEFKEAYWLGRAVDQLQSELNAFNKARFKLIEKYGKKDRAGKLIEKDNRYDIVDKEAFQKDFDEIAEQEIEIKYNPISADKFKDIKIAPKVLLGLGRLIEAPTE